VHTLMMTLAADGLAVKPQGKLFVEYVQLGFNLHHGTFIIGHQARKFVGLLQRPFHHIRADDLLKLTEASYLQQQIEISI